MLAGPALACAVHEARADESGASVWLPGQFASFAAEPGDPGFSLETIYYHRYASAAASRAFSIGGSITAGLAVSEDYLFLTLGYTFADPVLRGQLFLGLTFAPGRANTSISATLTGPGGSSIAGGSSDTMTGIGDISPLATLKWNMGAHNVMAYVTATIPAGSYDPSRIAGLGVGHWAIDGGLGYTYANDAGVEASLTVGLTRNFINPYTQYQSGIDGHLDWGASYSPTENFYLGAAGYVYHQLGGDSGPGARLGAFQSQVTGVGPQLGYTFALGGIDIDLNLRGYGEFDAQNRPEGWNVWFTVGLSRRHRASGPAR